MRADLFIAGSSRLKDVIFLLALSMALGCLHHAVRSERPLFVPPRDPRAAALPSLSALEVEKLLASPGAILVDARPAAAHARSTIPGSLSLPLHSNWPEDVVERLRQASVAIVFCADERCQLSRTVALALRDRGVARVKVFPGGMKAWTDQGLPTSSGVPSPPDTERD